MRSCRESSIDCPKRSPLSSRIMGAVVWHRRGFAWLALIALLSNVIAASYCHPRNAPKAQVVDEVLGVLVICAAHAGDVSSSDGDGTDKDPQPNHCTMCTVLVSLSLA